MSRQRRATSLGGAIYIMVVVMAGTYFTFAAVQGEYGLFRRIRIEAEAQALEAELARLEAEVAALSNKTRRLSDSYLDLDLLDEQARKVLGLARGDEIILR